MQDTQLYFMGLPCPQVFREQGIDGETLPLLTEEHLLNTMGLKLGPALKIRAQVSMASSFTSREGLRTLCDWRWSPRPLYLASIHPASSLCRWPSAWAVSSTWRASLWPCRCSHQAYKHLSSAQESNPCPQQPPPPHMRELTCPQAEPHPSRKMGQGP